MTVSQNFGLFMKKLVILVIVFLGAIQFCNAQISENSLWDDSLYFKQHQYEMGDIYKIRFSKDGSKFFTFSRDNAFRIWETETGLMTKELLIKQNYINSMDYNEKNNILIVCSMYEEYDNYRYTNACYSLNNDSLVFSYSENVSDMNSSYYATFDKALALYDERTNSITTFSQIGILESYTATEGAISTYSLDQKKIVSRNSFIAPTDIIQSNDKRFFAIAGYTSYDNYHGIQEGGKELIKYEVDSAKYKNWNFSNGVEHLAYSFDDKYLFFSTDSNRIVVFDTENNRVFKTLLNGYYTNDYYANNCYVRSIASSKENYDFYTSSLKKVGDGSTAHFEYIIKKWNPKFDYPVDSIVFNDPNEIWTIDISPDSKYLIAGGSKGHIRLINIESLHTGISEQPSITSKTLIIQPNPSSDFIELNMSADLLNCNDIEIVNSLGISQGKFRVNTDRRINISSLPKGIYFVKYCEYFGKFVKM